jgi:phage shock protein A
MVGQDAPDPQFDAMTARLLRREALRRAAQELNTTSGPGLEGVLARISAEVTAEAAAARATDHKGAHGAPVKKLP